MEYNNDEKKWVMDRHVPLAVLVAIVLQTGAWIWWAGSFAAATNQQLAQHEKRLTQTEQFPERLASLEAQSKLQTDLLKEIREELRYDRDGKK